MGQQGIQFFITIILARLLSPNDFGLIGILLAFIIVAEAFVEHGFGQAIIQKKEVSEADLTTAFLSSVAISVVIYVLLCFSAGVIASFYNRIELASLTRVVGVVVILDSLVVIQRAQYERELDFKRLSVLTFIAAIGSGCIAVFGAYLGMGVWALATQIVSMKLFLAVILWVRSSWVPRGKFCTTAFLEMFHFGWKLQVSGLLNKAYRNIHALVIGRFFAVDLVGYYTQARKLKDIPMHNLSSIVTKVTFPLFSSIQDDVNWVKSGNKKSTHMLSFLSFPLMLGAAATADRLIPVILGSQWYNSILFFQLLCLVGLLYPVQSLNVNTLKVAGRTDLFLKLEIVKKIIGLSGIVIAIRWGVYGLVVAQIITSYISLILNISVAGPLIGYRLREQLADMFPYFSCSTLMAAGVWLFGHYLATEIEAVTLIIQIFLGVSLYAGLCALLKVPAYMAVVRMLMERKHARTT